MCVVVSDVRIKRLAVHVHLIFAVSVRTNCVVATYSEELQKDVTRPKE